MKFSSDSKFMLLGAFLMSPLLLVAVAFALAPLRPVVLANPCGPYHNLYIDPFEE